jgi:GT2 family glycosyltransferase
MPDLSIIIVSYKGHERLMQCLGSLASFSGNELGSEVIVINNCPSDEAFPEIEKKYTGFRFFHNKINGGYAHGCNLGASYANGNYLLILNPDTVVTEDAIIRLISFAKENPEIGITSCRQVNEKGKESIAWGPFPNFKNLTGFMRAMTGNSYMSQVRHREGYSINVFFPDWVSGSVILLARDAYRELKGFDEDFWMYSEDVDLCRRARNIGMEIAFCTDITIEHNHGGSSRINKSTASLTKTEVYISRHVYFSKHFSVTFNFFVQLFQIINNLISSGLTALAGIIFFYIPKLNLRTLIFINLIEYYFKALKNRTWISSRSVNYK